MAKQNSYAGAIARTLAQERAAMAAEFEASRIRIARDAADRILAMVTIALHEEFGYGRDRIERLTARINNEIAEYGRNADDDPEYADEVVRRECRRIMKRGERG